MTIAQCDLALGTGNNDGTTWPNAYQGTAGLVTAAAALAAGDTIYVKNSKSEAVSRTIVGPTVIAAMTNPLKIIAVKAATTNIGGSIVQSDLIPGLRTGVSTRAYAYGSETPPTAAVTGAADLTIQGALYIYGMILSSEDRFNIASSTAGAGNNVCTDECRLIIDDQFFLIGAQADPSEQFKGTHCLITLGTGTWRPADRGHIDLYDCIFTGTSSTPFNPLTYRGTCNNHACDLSAFNTSVTIVNIASMRDGIINFLNCKMPTTHILTTGTAAGFYTVANYGSEDNTGITSGGSEQALEIHTHQGEVNIEVTAVRTDGADDLATGGWAYAVTPNNVTDNFVSVVSPGPDDWMQIWIEGDGSAKVVTVFIANDDAEDAGNLLKDSQVYLELGVPSAAGISMYDYRPDEDAPGDGGGRMQLLGTPANLTTTSETWGTGANNDQKLTRDIAPDYQGWMYCRVIYSKASGPILFHDLPEVAAA